MEKKQLDNNFIYHPIKDKEQENKYKNIRIVAKSFADLINEYCPESREKSLAFTKLEEAMMWANASIARNE